jgi:hypothetical protein
VAIAIRGTTPATAVTDANPISVALTGARQPQSGDLLVIIHGNDFYAATAMPTPTVGGSTSGVAAISGGSADAGTNHGHIKSYTYPVGSAGDLTVSVTETGSGDEDKCLEVYVLAGADLVTPTDGALGGFNTAATVNHDAPSISPSSANAFLICHTNTGGGSSASSYTPPSGMSEQYDAQVGGISHTGATLQLSSSGATGTKTFTPSGSVEYAAISIAIRTASGGATPISVGDTGSEAEALTVAAAVPLADAATSTQALTVAAAVPLADAGAATQALTAAAAVPLGDGGSAVDALVAGIAIPLADAGNATDALVAGIAIPLADTGTAADALGASATAPLADAGSAADTFSVTVAVPLADTAAAGQALTAAAALTLSDAAAALEAIGVAAVVPLLQASGATDSVTVDTGAGSTTKQLTDAGAVVDGLCVCKIQLQPDTGMVAPPDTGTVAPPFTGLVGGCC